VSNTLSKCHKTIPRRASGLVQIAKAPIEIRQVIKSRIFGDFKPSPTTLLTPKFIPFPTENGQLGTDNAQPTQSPAKTHLPSTSLDHVFARFNQL
jgi:hypothetical protein